MPDGHQVYLCVCCAHVPGVRIRVGSAEIGLHVVSGFILHAISCSASRLSGTLLAAAMFSFLWGAEPDDPDVPAVAEQDLEAARRSPSPAQEGPPAAAAAAGHRLRRGRLRRQRDSLVDDLCNLHGIVSPGLQRQTSQVFGFATIRLKGTGGVEPLTFMPSENIVVDKRRKHDRLRKRALVSHVQGTAKRLASRFRGAEWAVVNEVSDDATMWTTLPADDEAHNAAQVRVAVRKPKNKAKAKVKAKAKAKAKPKRALAGRNKATTCMSVVQHVLI